MQLLKILPRFKHASKAIEEIERRESWSDREIETWQLERINRIWKSARVDVPFYNEYSRQHRLSEVFKSLEDFESQVPIITGSELRIDSRRFLSINRVKGQWYRTSGTLAKPLVFFREQAAHQEILTARYRFYEQWGIHLFDRLVQMWGQWSVLPPRKRDWLRYLKQRVLDRLRNRKRISAYYLQRDELRKDLQAMLAYQPVGIYGFAQSVHMLALEASRQNFHCPSLKGVVLTSELITPSMLTDVARGLGAPTTQEYGCTECEFIGGMGADGLIQVRDDLVRVETLAASGGAFRTVFTVLNNPSFPLLRYQPGDTTASPIFRPSRGFSKLDSITGRFDDLIRRPDGTVVFPNQLDSALAFHEGKRSVRRFHLHQKSCGTLHLRVALFQDRRQEFAPEPSIARMKVLTGFDTSIEIVDSIPTLIAGKHRPITSGFKPLAAERS